MTPTITKSDYNSDRAELKLEITTPHKDVTKAVSDDPVKSLADLVFEEVNKIRASPRGYLSLLATYKKGFIKNKEGVTGKDVIYNGETIKTVGGADAVDSALRFLQD